jgi:hypothetical protein
MAEKQWGYQPHDHAKYKHVHEYESVSEPEYKYHDESPAVQPKYTYAPHVKATVKVQKVKKVYDPGYTSHAPQPASHHCPPIVCDPRYVVRDCYVPREVPVVHPIVNVNRHVIVNVPKHYYQPITKNVVVDPGCPCPCPRPRPGHY